MLHSMGNLHRFFLADNNEPDAFCAVLRCSAAAPHIADGDGRRSRQRRRVAAEHSALASVGHTAN